MVAQEISHYRIIKELGSGGMGEVFLAEDLKLERKVAIKMLPAKSIGDEHAKKRLLREARAAANLDHPNICAIHEVNEEGDCTFIVMQYVEGTTLAEMIKNNPLPPLDVIDIGLRVAEALADAHSHGIIHRDIKPQNVIVTSRGHVKVLDFGLAKVMQREFDTIAETESRLTEEGQVVGTIGYMSPEQLRGLHLDGRTDIFSLGATLFECATGKPAFSGPSRIDISLQVLQVDPPKPSDIMPGVPCELDEVIAKATAKDVDARYQSAHALIEDLQALRDQLLSNSDFRTRALTQRAGISRVTATGPISQTLTSKISGTIQRHPIKFGVSLIPILALVIWGGLQLWRASPYLPSPEARTWYDQGLAAMRAGTYYQASKRLERSIELDNRFAMAHARLAETYVEMDNTERAMEELLRALSLAPDRSALGNTDATYLDAIGATVRREFAAAAGHYEKILQQASNADKANAYVELGRAYEKNENFDKAAECYTEATKRDAQSPTGFLYLAILHSRRPDSKNADEAFKRAEQLYKALSNDEGRIEVLYQRGVAFEKTGKLSDAETQLGSALEILKNVPDNKYQLVKTKLQLSLVYRDEGNLKLAEDTASEAIKVAQSNNIKNLAANGLIDLGLALMNRGDFEEASKQFTQALELAQRDRIRRLEVRAILSLGRLNTQLGKTDEAISQLKEALSFYKPGGYRRETSIALTMLGRAYIGKGELEAAYNTFEEQLRLAQEGNDLFGLSDSHMNMATLKGLNQEMYPDALSHLDERYRIDESQIKSNLGFDQMNRGMYLWQLGRYDDARIALNSAFDIASQPEANTKAVLAWVYLINAQIALSQRQYDEVKKQTQLSLQLSAKFPDVTLHAKRALGLAEALSGAAQQGKKHCEEAVDIAKTLNSPTLTSSAMLTLAEVLLVGNEAQRALESAKQAQQSFAHAGGQDSEWRSWLVAARASDLMGNKTAAVEDASRADSLCEGLRQKWGDEAYESYLRRPDVVNYRKQIAEILKRSK